MAALAVLVVLLFGLAIWFGSLGPAPALGDYPDPSDLGAQYDRYLGDRATVSDVVRTTDPVTIHPTYGAGDSLVLEITDLPFTVNEGDTLRVFGVVEPEHTIRTIHAFTVPRSGLLYTWSISFVAGLWVLGRLLRQWRLTGDLTLERRVSAQFQHSEEETDA